VLVIQRGDVGTGLRLLRAGFSELGEARSAVLRLIELLMAEALSRAGQIAEGHAAIEEAIDHSESTEERWLTADLLQVSEPLSFPISPTHRLTSVSDVLCSRPSAIRQTAVRVRSSTRGSLQVLR
jgi:hypothetical protein